LFSLLFDQVQQFVEKHITDEHGRMNNFIKMLTLKLCILLFADDVALIAPSKEGMIK
jgi:hypothetical protein